MYFSDVFNVSNETLVSENVFDISLVSDLPLFIDPFLIFDSNRLDYQQLHDDIVRYVTFVRNKVVAHSLTPAQEREWLYFPEIRNNWLGYSVGSNAGRGLRDSFARGAAIGLRGPVLDFGSEEVSRGSHIERLFLFSAGTGKDALSDFITNLCHDFLLSFTQEFAKQHLAPEMCREMNVRHVKFDFDKERWCNGKFFLPVFKTEYVLLTPLDLLTQSVPWINRPDLFDKFGGMLQAVGDVQLRQNVNTFLHQRLAPPPGHPRDKEFRSTKTEVRSAYGRALELYPELANWYVAMKEATGNEAVAQSKKRVIRAADLYRTRILIFLSATLRPSGFFDIALHDKEKLLSTFGRAIEEGGRDLFLGEGDLLDDLSSEDVKLICSLAWRADDNSERKLPTFRFVSDSKSASQFESVSHSKVLNAGMLVVTTDRPKKSRVELIVHSDKLESVHVASITGYSQRERTTVESVFISYTGEDEKWAQWIGSVLRSSGYSVTVQYKDFLPGTNFVEQMEQGVANTDRTIAVLSPAYLKSEYAAAEWQAAFREDPLGHQRKLIPIRIARTDVKGLLGSIVYADIFGLSEESATAVLLGALSAENRPIANDEIEFPGKSTGQDEFQVFLANPPEVSKGHSVADAPKRLELAKAITSLSTNQVNVLVFTLNPPDNEIPPGSAAAKDRAAALLDWCARERIDITYIEGLVRTLLQ